MSNERICPECRKQLEDKFQAVKKYLEENPHSSMETVSREMEVSVKQIKQWVREERLEFSADSPVGIECEMCGASIRTGRFCEACKNRMHNDFSKAIARPEVPKEPPTRSQRDADRMRFLQ